MSKRILSIAAGMAVLAWGVGRAGALDLPTKATYLYFVQGKPVGKSDIRTVLEHGSYVVISTSDIEAPEFRQSLACRTEVDRQTRRPTLFRYEGVRGEEKMSGTVRIDGSAADGELEAGGTPYTGKVAWTDRTYLFVDYVPDHLLLMASDLLAIEKLNARISVLLPSSMVLLPAVVSNESEIELAARTKPVVCRKFGIGFQNAAPFFVYVDAKQGIPVYIDFPAVGTEVFLQGTYGDHPATKYLAPPAPVGE